MAEAVSFGSAGTASAQHLTGELLGSMAGIRLLHVPYKGDAGSLTALLAGDITFVVAPATAVLPHIRGGRMRPLAVTSASRWQGLPGVPTVHEGGVAGFDDVGSWAGLATTAGTPRAVVMRLHTELQKALLVPEVRTRLESFGGEVRGSTPEEMRARRLRARALEEGDRRIEDRAAMTSSMDLRALARSVQTGPLGG